MSNTDFSFEQGGTEIEVSIDPGAIIDANEDPGREVKPPPGTEPDLITRRTQQHELAGFSDMQRQVEDLKRQTEESNKRTREAETRLQDTQRRAAQETTKARQEAATTRKATFEAQRQNLDTAIQAIDAALDAAEVEATAAGDRGDQAAVAKANRKMAELAATRAENQRRKEQVDAEAAKEPTPQAAVEDVGGGPGESAFDKYVKQFTKTTADWMRKHPDVVTDGKKNRLALVAHDEAMDTGLEPESEAYFEFLEKRLGYTKVSARDNDRQNFRDVREATRQDPRNMTQQQRQQPRTAAPVSREGGIDGGRGSVVVRLTDGEVKNATDGTLCWGRGHPKEGEPIGVKEMGRRKAIMGQQGRYMNSDYQGG